MSAGTKPFRGLWLLGLLLSACPFPKISAQVVINELLASNNRIHVDPVTGRFTDWVELHNQGTETADLTGFSLSDDPEEPEKWAFPNGTLLPAGACLLVYADNLNAGLHTSFALSRDGESVVLSDASGQVVDRVDFLEQKPDVSFGRDPDHPGSWLWYGESTPGAPNRTPGIIRPITAPAVQFSQPAGFLTGSVELTLTVTGLQAGDEIHYTLDGSDPGKQSPLYSEPIVINRTVAVRARLFRNGWLPGEIGTRTWFLDNHPGLSVISVTLDPGYLWNDTTGIYVDGYRFDQTRESRNSCRNDWERPVNIELFDENRNLLFSELAGIQVKGKMNCEFPKKPFGIFFRSRYGNPFVTCRLFGEKDATRFSSFYLRPGGADGMGDCYNGTMFRDEFLATMLIGEMDLDYEGWRPAVLYVNGEYWGIHHIRERNKSDYVESNYGLNPDELDIIENEYNGGVISGDAVAYDELMDLVRKNDLNDPTIWKQVEDRMDVDEFINYQIAEIFIANKDWAANNVLCWRPRTEKGRFRWIYFDVEGGFGLYSNEDYLYDMLNYSEDNLLHHRTLFYRLMKSDRFRSDFLQRFSVYLSTTFHPDRLIRIMDSMKAVIEPEMPMDIQRWLGTHTEGGSGCRPIASLEEWEDHVEIMRTFARQRPDAVRQHLARKYYVNGTYQLEIESDNGIVMINGAPSGDEGLFFREVPLRMEAMPQPGYRFVRWEGLEGGDSLSVVFNSDTVIRAVFEPSGQTVLPDTISRNLVLKRANSPYLARGDVMIGRGAELILEAGVEIRMPPRASLIVYGVLRVNGTEDLPVRIGGYTESDDRWGAMVLDQPSQFCTINHLILTHASVCSTDPVKWNANLNIRNGYVVINGLDITDCMGNPLAITNSRVILSDSRFHSTSTCDLVHATHSQDIQILNSLFMGSQADDADGIDLDSVEHAEIWNCTFTGFTGYNCDGIDVGETPYAFIAGNQFEAIADKAVSVGSGAHVTLQNNLVTGCSTGVGVKDQGSFLLSDRNTFYNNSIAVHCFEKETGRGGGQARILNTLFAGKQQQALMADMWSGFEVRYSLDDKSSLPGEYNLAGDPGLMNAAYGQFRLRPGSVCINAGDPQSDPDPDGTLPDIGCYYRDQHLVNRLYINELAIDEEVPWVELYYTGKSPVEAGMIYLFPGSHLEHPVPLTDIAPEVDYIKQGQFILIKDPGHRILIEGETRVSIGQFVSGRFQPSGELIFDEKVPGYSMGHFPDGSYEYRWFAQKTPGAPNRDYQEKITGLYINELQAQNQSSISNELGQHEDWIEVYNSNPVAVDLGGLWLTDQYDQLLLWQIPGDDPEATTIAAQGYKVLWADRNTAAGPLHLDFKLDADGEQVALVQYSYPDTLILDSVSFSSQDPDCSWGRLPDGGAAWHSFPVCSPGFSNSSTGIREAGSRYGLRIYPVPASSWVTLQFDRLPDGQSTLQLIGPEGRIRCVIPMDPAGPLMMQVPVVDWPPGVYFLRMVTPDEVLIRRLLIR